NTIFTPSILPCGKFGVFIVQGNKLNTQFMETKTTGRIVVVMNVHLQGAVFGYRIYTVRHVKTFDHFQPAGIAVAYGYDLAAAVGVPGSGEIADGVFGKLLVEDDLIATFVVFGGVYGIAAFIGVSRSIRCIARFALLTLAVLSCLFFIVLLVLTIAEYLIQRIVRF